MRGFCYKQNLATAKAAARIMIHGLRGANYKEYNQWANIYIINPNTKEKIIAFRFFVHDNIMMFTEANGEVINQSQL